MTSCGGAIAVFVPADFRGIYTAFAVNPADPQLVDAFNIATGFLRNDGSSPIKDVARQTSLLYMLTAHVTQLLYGADGQSGPGIVGRVSSASEGSVSVSTEFPMNPNSAWYMQTPYGAMYWQATMAWRTVNYRPGPTRFGTGIGGNPYRRNF